MNKIIFALIGMGFSILPLWAIIYFFYGIYYLVKNKEDITKRKLGWKKIKIAIFVFIAVNLLWLFIQTYYAMNPTPAIDFNSLRLPPTSTPIIINSN